MNFLNVLFIIFTFLLIKENDGRLYKGYKVYSISARNEEQFQILRNLYTNPGKFDFWTRPTINREVDVMVEPNEQNLFESLLERHHFQYRIKIEDVKAVIEKQEVDNNEARNRAESRVRAGASAIDWEYYPRYDEITDLMAELESIDGSMGVTEYIGTSYEGRDILGMRVSSNTSNTKTVVVDANIHASEWISSASLTWIMNELIRNPANYSRILNGINYLFIPMLNPDGYEYSHTTERLWRHTRSNNNGSDCKGANPNMNFPFKFGLGASSDPCSPAFPGSYTLSESEVKALHDTILRLNSSKELDLKAYISLHSYGYYWFIPYGYEPGAYPPDYDEQVSLGESVVAAINKFSGKNYTVGTPADFTESGGGISLDWVKSIGVKYSITVELGDSGDYGFLLPPSEIVPNAKDMLEALAVVADRIRNEP